MSGAAASTGSRNVREIQSLQFNDGSSYAGQVLEGYTGTVPYGYGEMHTKEGFKVAGLFKDGKNTGEGIFTAPNGDTFYGCWNKNHKRHGKGLSVRASDGTVCVEEYEDGKLLKKVKRRPVGAHMLHWLPPLGSGAATEDRLKMTGDIPRGHSGHTMNSTTDGSLLIVFGGEIPLVDAMSGKITSTQLSNDVYMLDVAAKRWVKPATKGTAPPLVQGHTATLIDDRYLIVIGGIEGGASANSGVYVLDIQKGEWSSPIQKGLSFMNHTATLIKTKGENQIWVILQSSVFVLKMNISNLSTGASGWEWKEMETDNRSLPRQIPRSFINHSAVAVGPLIYVFGGKWLGLQHGEGKKYERLSADLRVLHTDTLMWEAPACTPPAAAAAASSSSSSSASTDYSGFSRGGYDLTRSEHTATLVGRKMVIIGGMTTTNPTMNIVDTSVLNDVQVLDVDSLQWEAVPALPLFISPRSLHACVAMPNNSGGASEVWLYGGRNSATPAIGEFNVLRLPVPGAVAPVATAKKAVAKPAATSTAASSSSASTSSATTSAAAADDVDDDLIDASSAGSGNILDAFLKGGAR